MVGNISLRKLREAVGLFWCCLILCATGHSQNSHPPDSLGSFRISGMDMWRIYSPFVKEDYTVYVYRRDTGKPSGIKRSVLYMTDGDWNMTVVMNCFSMLRQDYETTEPLIVGIGYGKEKNQRFRDLDPNTGGPTFLRFIEEVVMPFVEKHYNTNEEKAIFGYSMGGLFTTRILFTRPELFNMIFIGAPGNNGRDLIPEASRYFKDHKDLKSKVFMGVGSYETEVVKNIDSLKNYLTVQKCENLQLRVDISPNVNHGSGLAQVMQNAIAYGYCERHEEIKLKSAVLSKYKGTFICADKSIPNMDVFMDKNNLWIKSFAIGRYPLRLVPASSSDFFVAENERLFFTFKSESGKMRMVATGEDGKQYDFERE